jgi:hypothetical protein
MKGTQCYLFIVNTDASPERPVQIATLYFASPAGKEQGDVVLKNDKVYIGKCTPTDMSATKCIN